MFPGLDSGLLPKALAPNALDGLLTLPFTFPKPELGVWKREVEGLGLLLGFPELVFDDPSAEPAPAKGEGGFTKALLGAAVANNEDEFPEVLLGAVAANSEGEFAEVLLGAAVANNEDEFPEVLLGAVAANSEGEFAEVLLGAAVAKSEDAFTDGGFGEELLGVAPKRLLDFVFLEVDTWAPDALFGLALPKSEFAFLEVLPGLPF